MSEPETSDLTYWWLCTCSCGCRQVFRNLPGYPEHDNRRCFQCISGAHKPEGDVKMPTNA